MFDIRRFDAGAALRLLLAITLSACIAIFVFRTIHWPLLGDSSLMHYAIFLIERGAAPYRDIAEINMPGSYFVEWAAMHLFGGGDLAWRVFDFFLIASATTAMVVITFPLDWFAGFWAGALFLLIHGRDGILEVGQRDITLSLCLLTGYAFLFLARRSDRPWMTSLFGLFVAFAATIKPTVLLLGPVSLFLVCIEMRRRGKSFRRILLSGFVGWTLPLAAAALYLWREHAITPLLTMTGNMLIYHASLARRPIGYLLLHSVSPVLPLLAVWLVILALRRKRPDWERLHLLAGLSFGLFSYLSQAKGYSYQRYPLLAFLLLLMAMDFQAAWDAKPDQKTDQKWIRFLGIAGLAFGVLFLAPVSTAMASRYDWKDLGTVGMLEADLNNLAPSALAGGVQCVDSIAGCTNVLYRMGLPERSNVFYDEFLFGPASVPAVRQNREKFWRDLQSNPPAVIVVTERLFPNGPDDYAKLSLWPQFDDFLNEDYALRLQRNPDHAVRWWNRPEIPSGYRIYLRRQ